MDAVKPKDKEFWPRRFEPLKYDEIIRHLLAGWTLLRHVPSNSWWMEHPITLRQKEFVLRRVGASVVRDWGKPPLEMTAVKYIEQWRVPNAVSRVEHEGASIGDMV